MLYNGDIAYNQAHFNYSGVYVVSPQSFGLTSNFGGLKVLSVLLISPPSIQSTLVFINNHSIISSTGILENSETVSTISFFSFDEYGVMEIDKINADAYAISATNYSQDQNQAYVAVSIDKNMEYAVSTAESIILDTNSAGTFDITIISGT
jgi:hypothetical protein